MFKIIAPMSTSPNCFKCKHFYVTFDKYAPRGCRPYQIKSQKLPSIIVKESSGSECKAFEPKDNKTNKDSKDLNDPKYW